MSLNRKQKRKLQKLQEKFSYIQYIGHTPCKNKVIGDSPDAKQQAVITHEQILEVIIRGVRYRIVLHPGFVYDMASVPGIVTFIKSINHHHVNPNTTLKDVSSFHDLFYVLRGLLMAIGKFYEVYRMDNGKMTRTSLTLQRSEVDWLYYLGLEHDQALLLKDPMNVHGTRSMTEKETWSVYRGLVTFGWTKWNDTSAGIIKGISGFIHKIRLFFKGY